MEFIYICSIGLSLTVMLTLFMHAYRRRAVAGSDAFILQLACVSVWLLGALMELVVGDPATMIFWWKFQQIGVFTIPVSCVYFAVEYGRFSSYRRYLPYLWIVPVVAIVLIFTDSYNHIINFNFILSSDTMFGRAINVTSSPIGQLLVAYNFSLLLVSMIFLGVLSAKVAKSARHQAYYFILAILLVFVFSFLKSTFFEEHGINIPTVALYLPSILILFFNLFKYNLFLASPIARDKVFDVIEQGIVVTDSLGTIVDRNPYAMHLLRTYFGIDGEMTGQKMDTVFGAYPEWVGFTKKNIAGEMEFTIEDSQPHFFRIRVYPLQPERAIPIGTVTIIRDITARRMQEFALKNKADMDGLTSLLNRNGFMDVYMEQLKEAESMGEPVSVLMMDLDKFKTINDTYGHIKGDEVLVLFADLLRGVLRQQDAIGRFGGDEFAASLPGVGREEALNIAERIREKAKSLNYDMGNGAFIHVTLSIGICDNVSMTAEAGDLLNYADKAMYKAKNLSRNCCLVWE